MLRTHHCGQLQLTDQGKEVILSGWVQTLRNKGYLIWIDLRDRYGITQIVCVQDITHPYIFEKAKNLTREDVISVKGTVTPRKSPNPHLATGQIEIAPTALEVLNKAKLPPFTIEDHTDGGSELRMQYRYLDLRRKPLQQNLIFRHQVNTHIRSYLNQKQFIEIETPALIKSTPEGARDFLVPADTQAKKQLYYALPQSPQTLKQLLMIAGMDRYYQLVKCFRNEDLRADRQPEFTQLDCELSFVTQEDIITLFEGLIQHLFQTTKHIALPQFTRMPYRQAIELYGTDKPDLRWGMPFVDFTHLAKGKGFTTFDQAEKIIGITLPQGAQLSRKQIDHLTEFVKKPHIAASGLAYIKYLADGNIRSPLEKWYQQQELQQWVQKSKAQKNSLILMLAGEKATTYQALSLLRIHTGKTHLPHLSKNFMPLWVTDFPLLTWDSEAGRYEAMHHPFTAPKATDLPLLATHPSQVQAQSYDIVINGTEIGGGSVRIHQKYLQLQILKLLGFSTQQAHQQFGFLLEALSYGTPPHAGIAFGLDRLCMILGEGTSIRDYIAFPKNNAGRDVMLDAPSALI
ncbi:MAG: aspartate--tRNA ligase [Bacteroidota bacterium]